MAASQTPRLNSYPFIDPAKWAGKLQGKVAIVTGASVGIGRETCKAFAAAGAKVACVARREPELKSLVSEIEKNGGKAIAIVADVAAKGSAKSIVVQTETKLGPVDILINNAGITRIGPVICEDEDLDVWWRVYEVNVKAPIALIRAVLPSMTERNTGVLITIGSSVKDLNLPVMSAYSSSKAAIAKAHSALATELKGTKIRSHCISPGMVETELGSPQDAMNRSALENPLVKAFLQHIQQAKGESHFQDADVTANALVAISADESFNVLNGKFFDTTQDIEHLLQHPESVK